MPPRERTGQHSFPSRRVLSLGQLVLFRMPPGETPHVDVIAIGLRAVAIPVKFKLHFKLARAQGRTTYRTRTAACTRATPHAVRFAIRQLGRPEAGRGLDMPISGPVGCPASIELSHAL